MNASYQKFYLEVAPPLVALTHTRLSSFLSIKYVSIKRTAIEVVFVIF